MKVLVIGGSGYMGKALVNQLLDAGDTVLILNRGRTPDDFGDRVQRLKADRSDRLQFRAALEQAGSVDACIDFSAYEAQHVSDVVLVLAGKVGHYIFISTNSVYMSDIPDNSELYSDEEYPSGLQWNAVVDPALQQKYGWDKRSCEEVLVAAYAAGGFPATRLRIPAICGPGDTSYRWFRLHKWLQSGKPVYATNPIGGYCACFSLDVVSAVHATIAAGSIAFGQVYHITQSPASTLSEVIDAMACGSKSYPDMPEGRIRLLSPEAASALTTEEKAKCIGWNFLDASTHRGYSVAKAKKDLGWEPRPISEWYKITVEFFEGEMKEEYERSHPQDEADAPFNDTSLMAKLDSLYMEQEKEQRAAL